MEQMYQEYRDIAEFRMIYIREAHAVDGRRPAKIAEQKNIHEHTSLDDRCTTAGMLIEDKSLTIPTLVDEMDDGVGGLYRAWPDRVFLIRSDGRLAVAAERGPWGFAPALEATGQWLAEFKRSGQEPELAEEDVAAAEKRAAEKRAAEKRNPGPRSGDRD